MKRRSFFAFVVFLFAFLSVACGDRWMILRQANPNPLAGVRKFAFEPMRFDNMRVGGKSEAEYLAGKDAEQTQSFHNDKQGLEERFAKRVVEDTPGFSMTKPPPADAQTFVVRPHVTWLEPGFYVGVAARDSEVELKVQILAPDGTTILDELVVRSRIVASMTNPSSGGRLRDAGEDLGKVVAKYLRKRTGAE